MSEPRKATSADLIEVKSQMEAAVGNTVKVRQLQSDPSVFEASWREVTGTIVKVSYTLPESGPVVIPPREQWRS